MAGHTGAVAGKAQLFLGSGLYINTVCIYSQPCGNIFLHLGDVVLQLWSLGDHGYIDIAYPVTGSGDFFAHYTQ